MRTKFFLILAWASLATGPAAQPVGLAGLPTDRAATLPELRAALGTPTELRIEIDYMVDRDVNGNVLHSHRPTAAEIDAVVQMFACQGITAFIIVDDEIQHADVLLLDPDDPDNFFDYEYDRHPYMSFLGIKNQHFDRGSSWHYAVFGHQYQAVNRNGTYYTSTSSGLGERPGDDFIVTLGNFDGQIGTPWDRASTLAHEFGHNLGLNHAGNMSPTTVGTYAPNIPSVMTYFAQLSGIRSAMRCFGLISEDPGETLFKELDFSHGRGCTLNEANLSETFGMGILPVDWNCDGDRTDTGVQQDVGEQSDGWCGSTASIDILSDYDEWSNIVDVASLAPSRYVSEDISCATAEELAEQRAVLDALSTTRGGCAQPTPTVEGCTSRQMVYLRNAGTLPLGTCRSPARTLTEVTPFLGGGNIIYAAPGSYPTTGTVIDQPTQILSPGGAVFGD